MADTSTEIAPPEQTTADTDLSFPASLLEEEGYEMGDTDSTDNPEPEPTEAEVETADGDEEPEPELEESESQEEESELDEGESEEAEEDEEVEDSEETPPWLAARLKKMADQKNEAKEEAETYKAENEALKEEIETVRGQNITLQPTVDNPLADAFDDKTIGEWETKQRQLIEWAISNPEGVEAKDHFYEPAEIQRIKFNAEEAIRTHPAERRKYLAEFKASQETAKKALPGLFKNGTPEKKLLDSLTERNPGFINDPWYPELTAAIHMGIQVINGTAKLIPFKESPTKKKAPTKAKKSPPKAPTHAAGAPGPGKKREPNYAEAARKARETGDEDAELDALANIAGL